MVEGWKQEGGALHFLDARALAKATVGAQSSLHPKPPPPGTLPCAAAVAVQRVRWSNNHTGVGSGTGGGADGGTGSGSGSGDHSDARAGQTAGWLAHGGAAGLVCLQRPS